MVGEDQAVRGDEEARALALLPKLAGLLLLREPPTEKALKELFAKPATGVWWSCFVSGWQSSQYEPWRFSLSLRVRIRILVPTAISC
jgi:hypothetical protein